MPLYNTPIKNSFIQIETPITNSQFGQFDLCDSAEVCLPLLDPNELQFQLTFAANDGPSGAALSQNINCLFVGNISNVVPTLTVTSVSFGTIPFDGTATISGPGISAGTKIANQINGTPGGVGLYGLSMTQVASETDIVITCLSSTISKLGAKLVLSTQLTPPLSPTLDEISYLCSASAETGQVLNGLIEYVVYFQWNPASGEFIGAPGICYNLVFYILTYTHQADDSWLFTGAAPVQAVDPLFGYMQSKTCFTVIDEDCTYPTSVLKYANNSNAFGFWYNALIELVDNINFLNSIRLPLYLHSPEQTEDQMSYAKSDGSTLKLSHRIWADYKFKTDWLTAGQHQALVAATAHDLVFIICDYAGINPFMVDEFNIARPYSFTNTPTQFVRTEKINVDWKQDETPRFKLGQAQGVLRLAQANAYVNSDC